jgi:hypothetical protein
MKTKKEIINFIKNRQGWENGEEKELLSDFDFDMFEIWTNELESDLGFCLIERNTESEAWLEVVFYSEKIGKTIIFDHSYGSNYENLDEFVDCLLETKKEIETWRKEKNL